MTSPNPGTTAENAAPAPEGLAPGEPIAAGLTATAAGLPANQPTTSGRTKRAKPARPAGHLDVLDGVRALAAFSVVATHVGFQTGRAVNGFFAPFLARLDFGVTLFFLLSGFLLYRPFVEAAIDLRPRPETKPFLFRRFARIFPAYWVLLLLTMLVRPWDHSTGLTVQKTTWTDWIEYATLTHIYFGNNPHQALTHIWSLVVELSFYLVLPFIASISLRGRRPRRIMRRQTISLIVLAAIGPVYGVIIHQSQALQDHLMLQWLPAYLDWFALGMVLACLPAAASVGAWSRLRRLADELAMAPGTCWIIAGILFALSMTPVAGPYSLEAATTSQWLAKHLLYGATAFFMLLPLVSAGDARHPLRAVLSDRRVRWLGEISYSIFLFHLVLMFTLVDALHLKLFQGGFSTLFPLTVLCAVVAAALSYRLIERPAQAYIRRRTRRGAVDPVAEGMTPSGSGPAPAAPANGPLTPAPDRPALDAPPPPQPAPWAQEPPVEAGPWAQETAAPVGPWAQETAPWAQETTAPVGPWAQPEPWTEAGPWAQQPTPQQPMPQQPMPQQPVHQQALHQQALPSQAAPAQAVPAQAVPPQAVSQQATPQPLRQQPGQPQQQLTRPTGQARVPMPPQGSPSVPATQATTVPLPTMLPPGPPPVGPPPVGPPPPWKPAPRQRPDSE
jgi:peptidoglycan/LPS O-acetylase OafA/YrhL